MEYIKFQSTHPLRDATSALYRTGISCHYFNPRTPYGMRHKEQTSHVLYRIISIHAPLTGCDHFQALTCPHTTNFNPRTPYGMRPYSLSTSSNVNCISIHAPLTGCDATVRTPDTQLTISIHAPLTGCDHEKSRHAQEVQ